MPAGQHILPDTEMNAPGKGQFVRDMFAAIAPRYDLLNHLLSGNVDKRWRRFAAEKLQDVLAHPQAVALDLCCGTGDLTLELEPQARVIGCDFCHPMLVLARDKARKRRTGRLALAEADALRLPFADGSFDAVTIAFGLRNLENVGGGLQEIRRVLKSGGRAAVLEFSRPVVPVFRELFAFYFTRILPRIGALISGSGGAYTYLPASVSNFPDQKELANMMQTTGFTNVRYHNLWGGIAALHLGDR